MAADIAVGMLIVCAVGVMVLWRLVVDDEPWGW